MQPTRRYPIGTPFVLLHLLEGEVEAVPKRGLRHAAMQAECADTFSNRCITGIAVSFCHLSPQRKQWNFTNAIFLSRHKPCADTVPHIVHALIEPHLGYKEN